MLLVGGLREKEEVEYHGAARALLCPYSLTVECDLSFGGRGEARTDTFFVFAFLARGGLADFMTGSFVLRHVTPSHGRGAVLRSAKRLPKCLNA